MEKKVVRDMSAFADEIYKQAKNDKNVYCAVFANAAMVLIKELMVKNDVVPMALDVDSIDNNDIEYYIVLDDLLGMWVEPAAESSKEYKEYYADVLYIDGDANYSIVRSN